jgi:tRNA modification GTPase
MLRISGGGVSDVVGRLLVGSPTARGCSPARFRLDGGCGLAVLVARFFGPASYTGEDVVEIQFPGHPSLAERMLRGVLECPGTRLAAPGEFSARAFLRGRLTLNEAEGVAATIAARSTEQLNAARWLMAGQTGEVYRQLADECAALLALVEAGIDFTDQEDVVPIAPKSLGERLRWAVQRMDSLVGAKGGREHADGRPRVAIVGRPNAGKSTLFNALLGRRRAVASPIAGTTRDVLSEPLDLARVAPGAGEIELQDLPGLDPCGASAIEAQSQRAARDAAAIADALIWCDPSGNFDERSLVELGGAGKVVLRVRTFGDRPVERRGAHVEVCALDGWNLDTLRRALADVTGGSISEGVASLLPRHRRTLAVARASLESAWGSFDPEAAVLAAPEVVAGHLRHALDALGELVGHISPDDVIGRVFATFCVGK